jgi:hypothetical protein
MAQHFTKQTISASAYCKICRCETVHNVQGGRLAACTRCLERLEREKAERDAQPAPAEQFGLFGVTK